ncbi:MAG: flagellar hook-basal body protein [Armatimonadetes bacterium]|nr:flagellar hook-basal body protein [Armatimonadota bacterium]
MNRGIYAAASGMTSMEQWMDVTANNLANVSTTGFKRDTLAFNDTLEQQLAANSGQGKPIGSVGYGPAAAGQYTSFEAGSINQTGRSLDVALNDPNTMFSVATPGGTRYTRDGAFQISQAGQLVNNSGDAVLDSSGQPITLSPNAKIKIDPTGAITADDKVVGTLGIYTGSFIKEGQNLYTSSNAAPSTGATVTPGALEGSNVNAVSSMVELITLNRQFELAQKSIQQQDDLSQRLIQSLNQ